MRDFVDEITIEIIFIIVIVEMLKTMLSPQGYFASDNASRWFIFNSFCRLLISFFIFAPISLYDFLSFIPFSFISVNIHLVFRKLTLILSVLNYKKIDSFFIRLLIHSYLYKFKPLSNLIYFSRSICTFLLTCHE